MERKLKTMFEFQRFEGNRSLEKMIRHTEERSSRTLTEDELAQVAGGARGTDGEQCDRQLELDRL